MKTITFTTDRGNGPIYAATYVIPDPEGGRQDSGSLQKQQGEAGKMIATFVGLPGFIFAHDQAAAAPRLCQMITEYVRELGGPFAEMTVECRVEETAKEAA